MDSLAVNLLLYDWLSFTTRSYSPEELIDILGLSDCPWTDIKGAHGYRSRKYFSSISIHYDGRDDMGVWVEMSGQGCRAFESFSSLSWELLFSFLSSSNANITRLDVAFDDHSGVLDLDRISQDTLLGNFVSKSDYWEVLRSSKGSTVQIGSPQSKVLFRIYDKAAERNRSDEHWVRCEMQLRAERAKEFLNLSLPIGQAFTGVLLNYLRYVVPSSDSNKWRWDLRDYWRNLIQDAQRISIFSAPGTDYNAARVVSYVYNQAGNAIDALIQGVGVDQFLLDLSRRSAKPNPKYSSIVAELRQAYSDMADLQRENDLLSHSL